MTINTSCYTSSTPKASPNVETLTATPAATLPLIDRIKALIYTYNEAVAKDDAEYRLEYPDTPAAVVSEDVVDFVAALAV